MIKTLTHDEIVDRAYYVVESMLDATWLLTDKLKLLEQIAPYVEQTASARSDAFLRSRDETLTDFERRVARRDMGILKTVAHLLDDLPLKVSLTPFQ
jgi:hypothetical protein